MKSSYVSWQCAAWVNFPPRSILFSAWPVSNGNLGSKRVHGAERPRARTKSLPSAGAGMCVYFLHREDEWQQRKQRARACSLFGAAGGRMRKVSEVKLWCMGAGHENSLRRWNILQPLCNMHLFLSTHKNATWRMLKIYGATLVIKR